MIDRIKRWLGGPSANPPGAPIAAVTLPSGDVLVFDRAGHVLERADGPPEAVKMSVAREVGASGRFFRIVGERGAMPLVQYDVEGQSRWLTDMEVELTAIQCTPDVWAAGGGEGQPAGRATFILDRKRSFSVSPEDVWRIIRDAALRSPG